jgi:hypothetical protein
MVLSLGWQESQSSCLSWINSFGLSYEVLSDMATTTSRLFIPNQGGSYYFPHNCVVDQNQTLQYTATGFSQGSIQSIVNSLLEPEASCDPAQLNFGSTVLGGIITRDLTIDNTGTGILHVSNIHASNGVLFTANPTSGQVYALDDELDVTVTFHAELAGSINEILYIETDAGTIQVPLLAQVAGSGPFLFIDPLQVDFGEVEVGNSAQETVWAYSLGQETVSISSIGMTHPDFEVSPTSAELPSGDSIAVTITFMPTGPETISDVLSFTSTGGDREVAVSALALQAVIGSSVSEVNFGTIPVNGFQTRNFRVRNTGNTVLTIDNVSLQINIPTMSYNLGSTQLNPGDSATCYLIWTPHSGGDLDGTITFFSNGGNLEIPLVGVSQGASVNDQELVIPTKFELGQNYPNPFNASTMIPYAIPHSAHVKIAVYNTYGRQVQTFDLGEQPAGWHRLCWSGQDAHGRALGAGIYFYRLLVDGRSLDLRKMLYLK